jgi:anti-sigma regulatory factor (Ser/Thr protein kinase)
MVHGEFGSTDRSSNWAARSHVGCLLLMNTSAVDREQRTFDAVPTSAAAARTFVSETLRENGAPNGIIADFALAVSELATNIIEHGDDSSLTIYVDVSDSSYWELGVVGGRCPPESRVLRPETWAVAASGDPSGRGLGIVRHLMDEISAESTDNEVSICCRRKRVEE